MPVLIVGDLRLRPLRPGDETALLDYLCEPEVTEHTSIPPQTLESVSAFVRRDIAAYADRTSFRLALVGPDDRPIGMCSFKSWSPVHKHAELAYELSPHFWGQGHMRRAISALLAWGFSDLGLKRVHAHVMTTNGRSIRLLERCGFTREGTLRHFRMAHGLPRDFHIYGLLAQDFACTARGTSPNPSLRRTPPG